MNRLASESSPYLRQHQDNPVDWYPWGEEAFEKARAEDKPILLSVGYSACHWCHVMAHESFEDPDAAAVMNDLFVNVKVDREERPDVDAVYMEAVQAMNGNGGWPMTVFLAPDGQPFFGGTYYPPKAHGGRPGWVDVLRAVDDAWRNRREELAGQAEQLADAIKLRTTAAMGERGELGPSILEGGYSQLRAMFDSTYGGFGRAPKFPMPSNVDFMLRASVKNQSEETLAMVTATLDAMAGGGIYDHLGGGFHRYAVDPYWLVPHFEKMLYDQAGLVRIYTHGWQVTGRDGYRQVVEETIGYVLRDLRGDAAGGLYSAEDADSEGEEGRFYVWSMDELPEASARWWGATGSGNFEGRNILNRMHAPGQLLRPPEIEEEWAALFARRGSRVRPGLDDKVLTEWNAMFVSALAEAGSAMQRPDWTEAAESIASFLLANLRRAEDGRWLRSWQSSVGGRVLAYAVDYAWLADAFTRLAEATGSARWIAEARAAADGLLALFHDTEGEGFFTVGHDGEQLIVRQKDVFDGATPSANSVAAVALIRLGALTGESRYSAAGEGVLQLLRPTLEKHPSAFAHALGAVDLLVTGVREIAVVGSRPDLVRAVHERFVPSAVLAWGEPYDSPLWEGRSDGLAYVCHGFVCDTPVDSADALVATIHRG
jgi:uncharacterized protein YyaL (SSP411 family)